MKNNLLNLITPNNACSVCPADSDRRKTCGENPGSFACGLIIGRSEADSIEEAPKAYRDLWHGAINGNEYRQAINAIDQKDGLYNAIANVFTEGEGA